MHRILAACAVWAVIGGSGLALDAVDRPPIAAAVADPSRTPANVERDRYRHPAETLAFFGLRPDQTVVEVEPGTGWYTEILAPMLSARGRYIGLTALGPPAQQSLSAALARGGERYRGAGSATIDLATGASDVPDGSADAVLTFRFVHGAAMAAAHGGSFGGHRVDGAALFRGFHRMLKPGGVLGVEDHRLPEEADPAAEADSGYVKRSTVVRLAQEAGFRLEAESAVNANPADTHDWPAGVWTLPPTLRLGDKDRDRYLAVGESDRMTLRFVKPRE